MITNLDSFSHGLHTLGIHKAVVQAVNCVIHGDVALPEYVKIMKMLKMVNIILKTKIMMMLKRIMIAPGKEEVTSVQTIIRVED